MQLSSRNGRSFKTKATQCEWDAVCLSLDENNSNLFWSHFTLCKLEVSNCVSVRKYLTFCAGGGETLPCV